MYNTSASELEGVASDLGQIARTYTSAAHTLDQQVITLEGAVAHVLNDGVMQWKGLSSEAFVSAWLERRARLIQASTLMSTSVGPMKTLVQTIESNLSIIRMGQSIQTQAMFASMASNDQQSVLNEVSQAQNAIFMAMTALNSQLEALAGEVGNCPEVDREASTPGLYDNVNRNDAGGGAIPADEGGKGGDEPVDGGTNSPGSGDPNVPGGKVDNSGKVYDAKGNPDLRATRRPTFDKWKADGVEVDGKKFELNEHAYNSLFKSGRKDVMPVDITDALSTDPQPGTPGSVEYINPSTGTSVFVNPTTGEIVGVWPGSFGR